MSRAKLAGFDDRMGRPTNEDKRAALFRETPYEVCVRTLLGTAWALKPHRARTLAPLARHWLTDLFGGGGALPASDAVPANGELAGIARDLSVPTLMEGYRRGLFPHGHVGPALPHHARSGLRERYQGLRRTAPGSVASHLDHAAHHAQ